MFCIKFVIRYRKSTHKKPRIISALGLGISTPFGEISDAKKQSKITSKEIDFLKLSCSEMTYKEIANIMYLSLRTVEGYRDNLFIELNLKTRVGLVLYAKKNKIVEL